MGQSSKASAELEDRHPRLELELAANQVEFVFLRLIQSGGVFPIAAGVLHAPVQHRLVNVISPVVVYLGDLGGVRPPLAVENTAFQCEPARFPSANPRRQVGAVDPGAQLVQSLGVPPAIHVGFTRRQVAAREQPCIEALVADLEIPRAPPADLYARQGEHLGHLPGSERSTAGSNEWYG